MSIAAISNSLSGMRLAEARLSASASNIANVRTNGAIPGSGSGSPVYRPIDVVAVEGRGGGVDYNVERRQNGYGQAHDPSAPYADARGDVATPDVDLGAELIETKQAQMLYQASAAIMRAGNQMQQALLDRFV